jgi:phosphatidylinositol alpha-1,6-mannosyltransferase
MTRLLIVTEGPFYRRGAAVFDRYCFDRAFFDDYAAVFDEVRVATRIERTTAVDSMHRADGEGVAFVDLANVQGAAWVLAPWRRYCRPLADAVDWADAVCLRLPSVAGWHAARLARVHGKPLMFELIGDPLAAEVGSCSRRVNGLIQYWRTRQIVSWSSAGSYVSRAHLQRRYSAVADATTASISSIRLPASAFRPPRAAPARPDQLRLVFVGSFQPVKNHATLLRAVALARREGLTLPLTLVGDGPLRGAIEARIAALGLETEVRLTGHLVGRAPIEAELDAADLFVIPSWSEGLPRAAIEAMARGLPVIGSAVAGIRELLPNELLFDPREPQAVVDLIRKSRNPAVYGRWAGKCRELAVEFAPGRLSALRRALLSTLRAHATRTSRASTCSTGRLNVVPARQSCRCEPKGNPPCGRDLPNTSSVIDLPSDSSWCRSKSA